ncbi:MAG: hypothetical protein SF029_05180 [bacterium]|nr:hypothetical protein [bacterium]
MTDETQPTSEQSAAVHQRLRRLQEMSRSDIPSMMAHRSMSSFTLHEEPLPQEAYARALVLVYPQDPFVGEPEVRSMSTTDIGSSLMNSRVRVEDSRGEAAIPDADGNYLYWPGTPEFDQVNSFYYATGTLRMFERYARRALPWSFPSPRITIDPHVGDQANAFYHEQDGMLGFHTFKRNGKTISTAQSADIVSHETAHAVLDGLRDLYNESFGLGPTAFHESFGDMAATLIALHDDSLVRRFLDWTGGDMRMDNFVSSVAEQLTTALMEDEDYVRGHTIYLRNALNTFRRIPFDELVYDPKEPEFELGRQSHNYSRLFTGAFYDILAGMYEQFEEENVPPHVAIYRARDVAGRLLMTAIELGPVGEFEFDDMARAFLSADQLLYAGRHEAVMVSVFDQRALLSREQAAAHLASLKELPEVYLPKTINSALASALFMEQEIIPALNLQPAEELIPLGAYRNAAGYAFLTYFSSRRVPLQGDHFRQFNGVDIDVFSGLTLAFDPENRLRSAVYRPVLEEDIRQIKVMVADLIAHGLIVDSLQPNSVYLRRPPHGVVVPDPGVQSKPNGRSGRLMKLPLVVDVIPERLTGFLEYMRRMWRRPPNGTKVAQP